MASPVAAADIVAALDEADAPIPVGDCRVDAIYDAGLEAWVDADDEPITFPEGWAGVPDLELPPEDPALRTCAVDLEAQVISAK